MYTEILSDLYILCFPGYVEARKSRRVMKVPKGTSDYQATWIVDDDDDVDEDEENEEDELDSCDDDEDDDVDEMMEGGEDAENESQV